jgi:hypothetical protein
MVADGWCLALYGDHLGRLSEFRWHVIMKLPLHAPSIDTLRVRLRFVDQFDHGPRGTCPGVTSQLINVQNIQT